MNEKTLKTLEYDKVLSLVANCAVLKRTKRLILECQPKIDRSEIIFELEKTKEAFELLCRYNFSGVEFFDDFEDEFERAKIGSPLSFSELLKCARLLKASRIVNTSIISREITNVVKLKELASCIFFDKFLEKEITEKIISDEQLADNASEKLYALRKKIKRLNEKIREKLNSYIKSGDKYLQENLVTMRSDRYVIPVKSEYRAKIKGFVHDRSATGSTLFIEPVEVLEFNNDLRAALSEESVEVAAIIADLTRKVAVIADSLENNIKTICLIDEAMAKAVYAYKTRSVFPEINTKGIVDIKKGRHPLIDANKVVPLSFSLGNKYNYLLITGPNTGGKTVTLKLAGLFVLMAASGMFLPAVDGTTVSVFDNVFCDIGDEQSIEQSLSTFSSHLKNIVDITENCNENSFVLIDEIGAGTDPDEGAALAQSVILTLIEKGSKGIITTHYSKLKEFAYGDGRIMNASMDFDSETFAPLYKINIGTPGSSNALEIANRLGLSKDISLRAASFLTDNKVSFEKVLKEAEKSRNEAKQELVRLYELKAENEALKASLNKDKEKFETEKARFFASSKAEARRIVSEKTEEAEEIVEQIKLLLNKTELSGGELIEARTLKNKLEDKKYKLDDVGEERVEKIKVSEKDIREGLQVYVASLGVEAVIKLCTKQKKECEVAFGSMRANVKYSDLYYGKKNKNLKPKVTISREIKSGFNPEINVIGQTREEALSNVITFLDSAILNSLSEVRIVHGVGKGILLTAIREYLSECSFVENYRFGTYGEGERGVTIVTLK